MRLFFYGWPRFTRARALPRYDAADVVDDDPPYAVIARWHQVSWFGMSVNLDVPTKKSRLAVEFDLRHPIESVKSFLNRNRL